MKGVLPFSLKFIRPFVVPAEWQAWCDAQPAIFGLVMLGRSNVGKSSLINVLFGQAAAQVSSKPGKTRAINLYQCLDEKGPLPFYMIDLPGYGHASVSKEERQQWDQMMMGFFDLLPPTLILLNVQDARHPMLEADIELLNYLREQESTKILLLNKIDKLKTQKERAALMKDLQHPVYQEAHFSHMLQVSALDKNSLKKLKTIVVDELTKKLS
jgi:GTP-binding protein